jgi:hypothetical protein
MVLVRGTLTLLGIFAVAICSPASSDATTWSAALTSEPSTDCSEYGRLAIQKTKKKSTVTVKSQVSDVLPFEEYNFGFDYQQYKDGKLLTQAAADGSIQADIFGTRVTPGFRANTTRRTKYRFIVENDSNRCVVKGVIRQLKTS